MQESAQAALSYTRANAEKLDIPQKLFSDYDMHIHVPAGAIPKDGPSAGITLATAMISVLTGRPVKNAVAMTGEITLRGRVLAIGGIKEKALAAHRAGIKQIILPSENERDLEEIPGHVVKDLKFSFVDTMDEVIDLALDKPKPKAKPKAKREMASSSKKQAKK